MAIDTRFKRASAQSILCPFIPTTHTDTSTGVDADERAAVSWMYSGISIGAPSVTLLHLKSLTLQLGGGIGQTLSLNGNTIPVSSVTTIPSVAPPGNKGVVFYITGGSLTIYVWDPDTTAWIS